MIVHTSFGMRLQGQLTPPCISLTVTVNPNGAGPMRGVFLNRGPAS